jgi:hypothetical protein
MRLGVLGDLVNWGQGLLPDEKFHTCYRALAGHPNVQGAPQFAQAILRTLSP